MLRLARGGGWSGATLSCCKARRRRGRACSHACAHRRKLLVPSASLGTSAQWAAPPPLPRPPLLRVPPGFGDFDALHSHTHLSAAGRLPASLDAQTLLCFPSSLTACTVGGRLASRARAELGGSGHLVPPRGGAVLGSACAVCNANAPPRPLQSTAAGRRRCPIPPSNTSPGVRCVRMPPPIGQHD